MLTGVDVIGVFYCKIRGPWMSFTSTLDVIDDNWDSDAVTVMSQILVMTCVCDMSLWQASVTQWQCNYGEGQRWSGYGEYTLYVCTDILYSSLTHFNFIYKQYLCIFYDLIKNKTSTLFSNLLKWLYSTSVLCTCVLQLYSAFGKLHVIVSKRGPFQGTMEE